MRYLSLLAIVALSACTASTPQASIDSTPETLWRFDAHANTLRQTSCPDGTEYKRAESLNIRVIDAGTGSSTARARNVSGMTLSGAWQLEADNAEFGGLSGLDVLRSGSLLAITDDGKFVWIGVDPETGIPDGLGAMAYMRGEEGKIFPNKRAADSEDLAVRDGLAFVSFEQDHRIAAYDLETCGTAAHAAPVAALGKVIDGNILGNNRGPEALAFSDQTLIVGFETHDQGGSPFGRVLIDGGLTDLKRTQQSNLYVLTGMDSQDELIASVFRAYDPVRGTRAILRVNAGSDRVAEANLKNPLPVDNFEGVAIGASPSGAPRIWLISDDNFSSDQRTLLLAFDLDH